jgi:isopenicillin N synthase-like dioxygenase
MFDPSSPKMFTTQDYLNLHEIVFSINYPGYRPNVVEAPNGDGNKDDLKRYAHVSTKWIKAYKEQNRDNPKVEDIEELLYEYLSDAHGLARHMAIEIGVPKEYWPVLENSALRVLEYTPDATTAPHKDFDLFTLMLYRNHPQYFKYLSRANEPGWDANKSAERGRMLKNAQALNAQVHFGEILEEINPVWEATKHEVVASKGPTQYSIVYFAIPSHEAVLPSGITVGKWLEERIARSRYER